MTKSNTRNTAKPRVLTRAFYNVDDIITMFDCSKSYAYNLIKKMRKMQEAEGYVIAAPAGKIECSYFDSKVFADEKCVKH